MSISIDDMRSLMARSMRRRPTRYWFSINSPTERTRRLPRLSMSSISPLPFTQFDQRLDDGEDVLLAKHAHGVLGNRAPDACSSSRGRRREIVALGIKEQRIEPSPRPVSMVGGSPGRMTR